MLWKACNGHNWWLIATNSTESPATTRGLQDRAGLLLEDSEMAPPEGQPSLDPPARGGEGRRVRSLKLVACFRAGHGEAPLSGIDHHPLGVEQVLVDVDPK